MINFKKLSRRIGFHSMILLKGIFKMLYGTAVAALLALGIYGFCMVPTEGGYNAVFDFLASVCNIFLALMTTYAMGVTGKKGAKR